MSHQGKPMIYYYQYYYYVWVDDMYRHIYQIQISQNVAVKNLTMKYAQTLLFKIWDYMDRG